VSRIVIDARLESGRAGGLEQAIQGLVAGLTETGEEQGGDEIVIVAWSGLDEWIPQPTTGSGVRITHVPPPAAGRAARMLRATAIGRAALPRLVAMRTRADHGPAGASALESFEPDLVHFAHQRGELTRLPSVYEPWDLQHLHHPELFAPAERARRERWYRSLCADAVVVVAHCDAVRRDLIHFYGLEDDRITVIPMASVLRLHGVLDPDESLRRREMFAVPSRYALFPAQSWPHKNHLRLIEALRILRARGLDVPVVCPGANDANLASIRIAVSEAGVGDLLIFPGRLAVEDLRALYDGASMLVFPSLHEGFGLPIIEALDVGLPVVCSKIDSLVELAADAARYFEPTSAEAIADAVHDVWCDDGMNERLRRLATERASHFSWRDTACAYRVMYKRVLSVGALS
jgi:glycosyltransferase involved in cell wall biosynthesis